MVQPSGTVTFLFTDVEDSTRLWEEFPHEMRSCLEVHDRAVRSAIEGNDGYVFSTAGDAFCAAFSRVEAGVNAAVEAQNALGAVEWPEGCELRVRMGLHTGEAHERDGDYFGPAVNRAARIMSAGHGGQVLVSSATAALVADHGLELRAVGAVRLRGMARTETVSQIVAPGLPVDFPALRSREEIGNLPVARDVFVGRHSELGDLEQLLGEHRLVTLTGVGGVGKTRLATTCGAQSADEFSDGVWLVELAEVGDDDEVAVAVMTTLGLQPQTSKSPVECVIEAVAGQRMLLIFDNCEHVLDGAAQLADGLLSRAGRAVVLATSREGLGVAGEWLVPVRSLPVGPGSVSVQLFTERARAAGWTPAPGDDGFVTELCQRLDGVPLAIELAAARTGAMPLTEVVERLNDRFRLLAGRRGAVERHQTLRTTVAWSYDALSEDERSLFDRLSVFLGPFSITDAESVCADESLEAEQVVELLGSLSAKSMLVTEAGGYRLLETLRQYGEERLGTTDDPEHWRTRHLAHYVKWAGACPDGLWGPDETIWVRRLRFAWPNLRAAVQFAIERGDAESAAMLVSHVGVTGANEYAPEMGAWVEQVLALDGADAAEYRPAVLALASIRAGATGDANLALTRAEEAKRSLDAGSHDVALAVGFALGSAYAQLGRTDEAVDTYRRSAEAAGFEGRPAQQAWFTALVSFALTLGGQISSNLGVAQSSVEMADATGNPTAQAWARYALGLALLGRSPDEARSALEQVLELEEELVSQGILFGTCRGNLALMCLLDGQITKAMGMALEVVRDYRRSGSWGWMPLAMFYAGGTLLAAGRTETAAKVLGYTSAEAMPVEGQRRLIEQMLVQVRSTLGETSADELVDLGARLTPQQAAELAERELEAPQHSPAS